MSDEGRVENEGETTLQRTSTDEDVGHIAVTTQAQGNRRRPRPKRSGVGTSSRREKYVTREGDASYFRDLPYTLDITSSLSTKVDRQLGNYAKTNAMYGQLTKHHFRVKSTDGYFKSRQNGDHVDYSQVPAELQKFMQDNIKCSYKFFSAPDDKGIIFLTEDLESPFYDSNAVLAKLIAKEAAALSARTNGATDEDVQALDVALEKHHATAGDSSGEEEEDDDDDQKESETRVPTHKKVIAARERQRARLAVQDMMGGQQTNGVSLLGMKPLLIRNQRYGEDNNLSFLAKDMEGLTFGTSKRPADYTLSPRELASKPSKASAFHDACNTVLSKCNNSSHKDAWTSFSKSGYIPPAPPTGAGYKKGDAAAFAQTASTKSAFPTRYSDPLVYIVERVNKGLKRSGESTTNKETVDLLSKQASLFTTVAEQTAFTLLDDMNYDGNFESVQNKAMNALAVFDQNGGLPKLAVLLGKKDKSGRKPKQAKGGNRQQQVGPRKQRRRRGGRDNASSNSDHGSSSSDDSDAAGEDTLAKMPRYQQLLLLPTWTAKTGVVSIAQELADETTHRANQELRSYILAVKRDKESKLSGKNHAVNLIFALKQYAVKTTHGTGNIRRHTYDEHGDMKVEVMVDGQAVVCGLTDIVGEDVDKGTVFTPDEGVDGILRDFEERRVADCAARVAGAVAAAAQVPGQNFGGTPLPFSFNDAVMFTNQRGGTVTKGRIFSFNEVENAFVVRTMMRDDAKLSYMHDSPSMLASSLKKLDRKEAVTLRRDGFLPRIPPQKKLTKKEKEALNVLCTLCDELPTADQAEYCECYETNACYTFLCADPVCQEILHEHQQSCQDYMDAVREEGVDAAAGANMDVVDAEADAGVIGGGGDTTAAPVAVQQEHPLDHMEVDQVGDAAAEIGAPVDSGVHADSKTFDTGIHRARGLGSFIKKKIPISEGYIVTTYHDKDIGHKPLGVVSRVYETQKGRKSQWRCEVQWRSGNEANDFDATDLCYVEAKTSKSYENLESKR